MDIKEHSSDMKKHILESRYKFYQLKCVSMHLLLPKNCFAEFLNRFFEATLCYLRILLPDLTKKQTLSFINGFIVGMSNVVTYHSLLNLESVPGVRVAYMTF